MVKCDRCKEEISPETNHLTIRSIYNVSYMGAYMNLCDNCYYKLVRFINNVDALSKRRRHKMTDKEAIKWLNKNRPCISMTCNKENADNINIATDMAIAALEERPQGEWITIGEEQGALGIIYKIRKCSKCGWEHSLVIPDNFCPNCGADMRGEMNDDGL